MLSTNADAIFWMGRYLERTANTARFLDVNWFLALDVAEEYGEQWKPLVTTSGDEADFDARYPEGNKENVIYFLTSDPENPNSILSCTRSARYNASRVRNILPTEMWEAINVFYHYVESVCGDARRIIDAPNDFCAEVKWRNFVLGGISTDIMAHDEAWLFFRLGRLLERADKTSRVLDVKYFMLLPESNQSGSVLDYVQWGALLKAVGGFQAFRECYGRISPRMVAEFLILNPDFPRSMLYCLTEAQHSLHEITGTRIGYFSNPAEMLLGQVISTLSYHTVEEIFTQGLHEFTDDFQMRINSLGKAFYDTFFTLIPTIDPAAGE